jgi:hypothetical protein
MSEGPECQQNRIPNTVSFKPPENSYTMRFINSDGEEVGVLDFNGPGLAFEGVAEASAILFMTWVGEMFKQRLDQEYKRGFREGKNQ